MTENDDCFDSRDESCVNTGLVREKCRCLDCWPIIHRFKWICASCVTIDDVIGVFRERTAFFEKLREDGWRIGGPIDDDYMELVPPIRDGYYWHHCNHCGSAALVPDSVKSAPETCVQCEDE